MRYKGWFEDVKDFLLGLALYIGGVWVLVKFSYYLLEKMSYWIT